RDGQGARDLVEDGDLARAERAEVALQQAAQEGDVPDEARVVETARLAVRLARLPRRTLAQRRDGRVDVRERHHDAHEERDAEDHDRQLQEAATDEAQDRAHGCPPGVAVVRCMTASVLGTGPLARGVARGPVVGLLRSGYLTTPASRKDSPVTGRGLKPWICELSHAVGSLRCSSGYSGTSSEIRSYAWFHSSCCSSPEVRTAESRIVCSSANFGSSFQR